MDIGHIELSLLLSGGKDYSSREREREREGEREGGFVAWSCQPAVNARGGFPGVLILPVNFTF